MSTNFHVRKIHQVLLVRSGSTTRAESGLGKEGPVVGKIGILIFEGWATRLLMALGLGASKVQVYVRLKGSLSILHAQPLRTPHG